jgi:hypothetical protein
LLFEIVKTETERISARIVDPLLSLRDAPLADECGFSLTPLKKVAGRRQKVLTFQ